MIIGLLNQKNIQIRDNMEKHQIECPSCKTKIGLDVYPSWFSSVLVFIGVCVGVGLGILIGAFI